ncbi:hypothetical protein [Desulfosporosinus sp.]|uniref:hypothetical protein n=1 Tax=Desulfosporosinus sp. TaxID=157907 RepID=UPI0025C417A2|nr:hypothetical protein [Desulfosporosinus sp.]MBC2721203.1 hypothetical protein [Desulfosporosinus sp.]MBC2728201.1 hypothetical protein [Desulfosporosinus sp.]
MTKKLLLIGVIGLLILGCISTSSQYSYVSYKKTTAEYINLAKEFMQNNPEPLNSVENKPVNYEDIVANIDLLPISIGEIEFRKGLSRIAGFKEVDDKTVFNTLVEEKIIISYAIKNNVFPAKRELNNFMESERSIQESNEEATKIINFVCSEMNISVEDYWTKYEPYNAFRLVTFKKAYDHAIKTGKENGEVNASGEYQEYWNKLKKEIKENTSSKVNKEYRDRGFVLDKSKLYL